MFRMWQKIKPAVIASATTSAVSMLTILCGANLNIYNSPLESVIRNDQAFENFSNADILTVGACVFLVSLCGFGIIAHEDRDNENELPPQADVDLEEGLALLGPQPGRR